MIVILYKYLGERNAFPKQLNTSTSISFNATIKEQNSILSPILLVQATELPSYNYAYIPSFSRYYFIDDITSDRNNLWRLSLSVDVLESYNTEILNQTALISRSESDSTEGSPNFTQDNRLPITAYYSKSSPDNQRIKVFDTPDFYYRWFSLTYFSTKFVFTSPRGIDPYATVSHTVLLKIYAPTLGEKGTLLYKIINDIVTKSSTFGSYISAFYAIPFNCANYLRSEITDTLDIGDEIIDLTPFTNDKVYTVNPSYVLTTTFRIKVNNFLDLPPYSKYMLRCPLVDTIEIPNECFFPKSDSDNYGVYTFEFDTIIDFTIGTATYKLRYFTENSQTLATESSTSVPCMNPIPVNLTNSQQIDKTRDAYLAGFISNTISNVLLASIDLGAGAAMAPMTGGTSLGYGAIKAGGRAVDIASTGIDYYYKMQALLVSGSVQKASSIFSSLDVSNGEISRSSYAFVLKLQRQPILSDDYYKYNGHACNKIVQLTALNGYTEVADIHLEGINATSDELQMIEEALYNGVIIIKQST